MFHVFAYLWKITSREKKQHSNIEISTKSLSYFGPTEPFCPYGGSLPPRFVMSLGPALLPNTLIFIDIALIFRNWVIGNSWWFCRFALFPPSLCASFLQFDSIPVCLHLCNRTRGGKREQIKSEKKGLGLEKGERRQQEMGPKELYKRLRKGMEENET